MTKITGTENSKDSGRTSRTRYYVYNGPACNTWLDYDDLDTAAAENPNELVWDRETKLPAYQGLV